MRLPALALALLLAAPALAQTTDRPAPDDPATWTQTAKGVRLLGGSASLSRQGDFTSALATPRVGAFVADGLALGVDLTLGYGRSTFTTAFEGDILTEASFSSTTLGVGPSVTYYLGGGRPGVRPFVEADVALSYQRSRVTTGFGTDDSDDVGVGGGLGAGVSIPIARNVALRAQAFYRTFDFEFDDSASYGLSAGFTTFIY